MTLCPDDGIQKVRAHKVVLAACSPFFKRILEGDSYSNTLLYLKGVDENSLSGILDFIYNGEVNFPENRKKTLIHRFFFNGYIPFLG